MKKIIPNTPIIEVKEEIIQTDLGAQDILKTKQLVPHNFVKLEIKYFSSTLPNWPKPLGERYSFPQGEDWLFLDVPQELIKELEAGAEKEIFYPFYLASEVLKRKPFCGGITLESTEEVFLLKPLTSEKEAQTDLNSQEIKEKDDQITQLNQQIEELEDGIKRVEEVKDKELTDLRKELSDWQTKFPNTTPEKLTKELSELKFQATAVLTLVAKQEQKFDKLKKLAKDLCQEPKKYKDISEWENQIVEISK